MSMTDETRREEHEVRIGEQETTMTAVEPTATPPDRDGVGEPTTASGVPVRDMTGDNLADALVMATRNREMSRTWENWFYAVYAEIRRRLAAPAPAPATGEMVPGVEKVMRLAHEASIAFLELNQSGYMSAANQHLHLRARDALRAAVEALARPAAREAS